MKESRPQTADIFYEELSREDLIALVKQLVAKERKFGLVWEEKPENVVLLCETKLPVLNEDVERHIKRGNTAADSLLGDDGSNLPTHLLIEGDNYHALSVLNYTHAGKIDVIYIDPPYNTGNRDFIYNDRYVDKEDAYRHSKWLSFMEKRLLLAKNLLAENGVIFISIDDNEQAHLRLLCDEVFGEENFVDCIVWDKKSSAKGVPPRNMLVNVHEYIMCCQKSDRFSFVGELRSKASFSNPDNDPRGLWRNTNIKSTIKSKDQVFTIIDPETGNEFTDTWAYSPKELNRLIEENVLIFPKNKTGQVRRKEYYNEMSNANTAIKSSWGLFDNQKNTETLKRMLPDLLFLNPKPLELMERLLRVVTHPNSTILDFFAGSGTTGHAVLELNASDGGNRQFILCTNNENGIAENVTYPRIKKVIEGYGDNEGIPAEVRYFRTEFFEQEEDGIADTVRHELVERATDMLKIRENTFTLVDRKANRRHLFEIYTNVAGTKYTAIIYDTTAIEAVKKKIVGKTVRVYIFTLDDNNYESDFDEPNWCVEPLPERVLQVYKRLFAKQGKKT